jgi:hypothetical protein
MLFIISFSSKQFDCGMSSIGEWYSIIIAINQQPLLISVKTLGTDGCEQLWSISWDAFSSIG